MDMTVNKTREWYAVGVDRHSSRDFFVSTDPERFEGSSSYRSMMTRTSNQNDVSNLTLLRGFECFGCDIVFSSSLDRVKDFVRDRACRVLIMHCGIQELGGTTQLLIKRQDIIQVLLYNCGRYGSDRIDFSKELGFQQLPDPQIHTRETNVFVPPITADGELAEPFMAIVKPFSLTIFLDELLARVEG